MTETTDVQQPVARVRGEAVLAYPADLYIPPDALEVFLETFQGPLDLLLYLIRKHNLDILDIPILAITQQYMAYVTLMKHAQLSLAADYLVMAALLAEIKSRMLLPTLVDEQTGEEIDPRTELVRRLQAYEQFKQAAESLEAQPQLGRDRISTHISAPEFRRIIQPPLILEELLSAGTAVWQRAALQRSHVIKKEPLSVRARMAAILEGVQTDTFTPWHHFWSLEEGRTGLIVTFLAILELTKSAMITCVQHEPMGTIYLKAVETNDDASCIEHRYH